MPDSEDRVDVSHEADDTELTPTRRNFVKAGVGAFGIAYAGTVAYPIYRYLDTPAQRAADIAAVTEVSLKDADKLEVGAAMMFRFGSRPSMLIHHKDGSWSAFSAVCTHLSCTVQYQADRNRIHCACHGGVYDPRTGEPVAGPPPKALTEYTVEVNDGEVIVGRG
jgi:cytochrome b6-f complex iron-sulfur subunit